MELEIEGRNKSGQVNFWINKALFARWKAKVKSDGVNNYSKVIEALMRAYLGERLAKK